MRRTTLAAIGLSAACYTSAPSGPIEATTGATAIDDDDDDGGETGVGDDAADDAVLDESDGGSDDDGAGGAVWRPFASDSPWNTRIPADVEVLAESADLVADLATSSQWPGFTLNLHEWTIPAYQADAMTPLRTVQLTDVTGWGMDQPMPIPLDAEPDPAGDHHLCVYDRTSGLAWDLWNARHDGDSWTAGVGAAIELDGSGVRPPKDGNQQWQWSHGARACGFPLLAGLIRVEEIQAGRIDHALALAYPHIRSHWYTPPASTAQGTTAEALPDRGMPCGMRVQLDPDLDLDALDLSPAALTIARALQEYGAFVADYGGAISLYADGSLAAQGYWGEGVLQMGELMGTGVEPADLRVIAPYGAMYEDQN